MSSANSRMSLLLILAGILILALMVGIAVKSGKLPNFIDPYGLSFVLVGGVALVMISFPGVEIRRALRHAAGIQGNDAEIRLSIHFWEATARGFWMLGGLRSFLNLMLGFEGMKTHEAAGMQAIIGAMVQSLLSTFYGILLAVICLIPCLKLIGKLQSQLSLPSKEQSKKAISNGYAGRRYGAVIGYVLFVSVAVLTISNLSITMLWNTLPAIIYWPSLLVVVGGTLALLLFIGGVNSGPTFTIAFAAMGLIGSLMAVIQALVGMFYPDTVRALLSVAANVKFMLSSGLTALLGMILVGAPLEDRAIRIGRVASPSVFSRASWYAFPLLTLILVPLMVFFITTPMPSQKRPVIEVHASVQDQGAKYEARAPQSEPIRIDANFQESNLIYKVNPAYPEQARKEGIQGTVRLTVIINEEGFVYEVKGGSENNPILEKAAIPAVKKWRYKPMPMMGGLPVAIKTTATVNFTLN